MLRIIVEIVPGGVGKPREVAQAVLGNMSDFADRSDYSIRAREDSNVLADAPAWDSRGHIRGHDRNQTVWRLVERAAKWAAEQADMGCAESDSAREKFAVANQIALTLERFAAEHAAMAAAVTPDRMQQIADGRVKDIPLDELRRVLAALANS